MLRRSARVASKDLKFSSDLRSRMLEGVGKLTKAVSATLGPKGRNVVIQQSFGPAKITKDGVTVAKAIEFSDPHENLGAQLVRQVASKTNDQAGDGTTTSTVLANALYQEGFKRVVQGASPIEMKRGIDKAVDAIVADLKKQSKETSSAEEITQVATISANGDEEIGALISEAMAQVSKDGVITTADGKTLQTELEVVHGMSLDRGYISPYFVNNTKTQKVEFEDPFILVIKQKLNSTNIRGLIATITFAHKANRPLLIVAEDVEGDALGMLLLNKLRNNVHVAAVKAPGFGDNRTNMLQDLAISTGARMIDEEAGEKMPEVQTEDIGYLGSAKKVTISKEQTIILNGGGESSSIDDRVDFLKGQIEAETSDYAKEKMQERLAKLVGGVAVIKVGGASEVEVGERKDRIVDALNATRCAIREGIVPGGGKALLNASRQLEPLMQDESLSEDQRVGVRIAYEAVKLPAWTIAENCGESGSVIVDQLLNTESDAQGYDARNNKFVDMFEAGIIDPTQVVRTALQDASSVAGLLLTTEAAVTDIPKEAPPAGGDMGMGGMGGGMGGMGGMGGGMGF